MTRPASGLRIAKSLRLPIESVTETFALIGRRGSGKTNSAVAMVEEMIAANVPAVIVDPTGAWWGLRSSADGKGEGLPVVIFGGEHADVPLVEAAGEVIADAVVASRHPAIIDLSDMSKSAMRRFMADFAERLYRKNREPLHLILDEADVLVPQRLDAAGMRVFGAIDDIVRRGRIRGLGVTLITQRPAVINKDVLSQVEVLLAMQLTSKIDVAAIDDWVRLHATDEEARLVKGSLASLPTGTGWLWSPALLGVLEKVQIRPRRTFDSSATPKPGQRRIVAEAFAAVDTAALGQKISSLEAEAASTDPKALRAKIARLERELVTARSTPAAAPSAPREVLVEVPVLTDEQAQMIVKATEAIRVYAANACDRAEHALAEVKSEAARLAEMIETLTPPPSPPPDPSHTTTSTATATPCPASRSARSMTPRSSSTTAAADPAPTGGRRTPVSTPAGGEVTPARQRLLDALADMEAIGVASAKKSQVALWAGVSPKSSGFANNLGALRSAGLIDYPSPGHVGLTDAGRGLSAPVAAAVSNEELHRRIAPLVSPARWRLLEILIQDHPADVAKEELAARAGVSAASSGFANNLGALRSLGLLDYPAPGRVAATSLLFIT